MTDKEWSLIRCSSDLDDVLTRIQLSKTPDGMTAVKLGDAHCVAVSYT